MDQAKIIRFLKEEFLMLKKSLVHFNGSLEKCRQISKKEEYTFSELESFDSLTSRFSRTSDIFIQKILRTVFIILREDAPFLIDRLNKAEKAGLITSADKLLEIKDLRNEIVHQYIPELTSEIVSEVMALSADLLKSIEMTETFLKKHKYLL